MLFTDNCKNECLTAVMWKVMGGVGKVPSKRIFASGLGSSACKSLG